jgi:hypothetical protein
VRADAIVYALFAVVAVLGAAVNNRLGLRYSLALGTVGFPFYGAALYTNSTSPTTWFLFLGSALCGISAGLYFTAEAAIVIG